MPANFRVKIETSKYIKSSVKLEQCPSTGLTEVAVIGRSNVGKSSLAWFSHAGKMGPRVYAHTLTGKGLESCVVCPVHFNVDIAIVSLEPNPRNFDQMLADHAFSDPEHRALSPQAACGRRFRY